MKKLKKLRKSTTNYQRKLKKLSISLFKRTNSCIIKRLRSKKAKSNSYKIQLSTKIIKYGSYKRNLKKCTKDSMNSQKKTVISIKYSIYNKRLSSMKADFLRKILEKWE